MKLAIRTLRNVTRLATISTTAAFLLCTASSALTPISTAATAPSQPGVYNPVANPAATVTLGNARFTILTSRLLRMEWSADGHFEDHASLAFLNRNLPVPAFTHTIGHDASLHIDTADLHLVYHPAPHDTGKFTAANLEVRFTLDGKPVVWHPGDPDTGNLLGTTRTLDRARGDKTLEPIGPGLISRDGWAVVDDSTRPLFDSDNFSFSQGEQSPWPWVLQRPTGDRQDLYFFGYGHDYKQALGDYIKVAGRIPLPPYFAFGTWWSRYWSYSDQGFEHLIHGFRDRNVPLDVLVMDMDWHPTSRQNLLQGKKDQSGQHLGWTGFSFNKLLFPDPAAFLANVHREGLKVTMNLHPASGIQPWETRYPEMARAVGIDPATHQYVPFDITSKKFVVPYMDLIHHPLEKEGVDFWWLDWQQGSKTAVPHLDPTWWLNYVYFTDQEREGKRPLLFGRWGGLGNHRYQIGFSGDVISVWESLAFQPWFTATAANVGYAYWSHDIGGHMPGAETPELYTRWIQFGALSPILRTHTSTDPEAERRIWAYPEPYSDIMRSAFDFRYEIAPYIYTEARRTYDTGVAFDRPLYYDWPEADQAYNARNEYMFGNQMLAAPVTVAEDASTKLASESVWLPEGQWIEWDTGKHFTGPLRVEREVSTEEIPIYVRPGTIIPMAPPMQYTGQKPVDPLILTIFPLAPGHDSTYTLYEDARDTRAYQENQAERTPIHASQQGDHLTVTIDPAQGTFPGMEHQRSYVVRLPADWPPQSVSVDGKTLAFTSDLASTQPGWSYDGNTLTTIINTVSAPVDAPVVVRVERNAALMAERNLLDGFPGAMLHLREARDTLLASQPLTFPPDELVDAVQAGDRLTFHPDTAEAEMKSFHAKLLLAQTKVGELADRGDKARERAERMHKSGPPAPNAGKDPSLQGREIADFPARFAQVKELLNLAVQSNDAPAPKPQ